MKRSVIAVILFLLAGSAHAQLAVRGDMVYTMEGAPIENGVVLVRDGQIEAVGPAADVAIPDGYRVLDAAVVTPGLVDARGTVGLSGILNQPQDQDHLDTSDPIQPELRAIDAYDPTEDLVEWVLGFGVTTVQVGPSPGAPVGGQTAIFKTHARTVADGLVEDAPMVAITVGSGTQRNFDSPGTRSKLIAELREALLEAQRYAEDMAKEDEEKRPARDLRKEALARVLSGEAAALVTAHRAHDIRTALRLADEFDLRMILDGGAESYLVINQLKAANVPVILHPTMIRAGGEAKNASFETAKTLHDAGLLVAIQSGYEAYVPKTRVVLFEAAIAAANGLGMENALRTITIDAAQILGIADRVGSLAEGKDADLVLFDGDPFEYTSHVCTVIAGGEVAVDECR
ncbi:MAG: amidohydrolase family protein [Rhodothermales bacterium]